MVRRLSEEQHEKWLEDMKKEEAVILEGRKECIRMLLQRGVDINAQDADGRTALYYAKARDFRPQDFLAFLVDECGARMPADEAETFEGQDDPESQPGGDALAQEE